MQRAWMPSLASRLTCCVTLGKLNFLSACHLQNVDKDSCYLLVLLRYWESDWDHRMQCSEFCHRNKNCPLKALFPRCREFWEPLHGLWTVLESSQGVKGSSLTPGLGLLPVPLPVCTSREEGMSELSGGGGDRWSPAEQEGSANQRRSGSSIRTWSRWVWGGALPSLLCVWQWADGLQRTRGAPYLISFPWGGVFRINLTDEYHSRGLVWALLWGLLSFTLNCAVY